MKPFQLVLLGIFGFFAIVGVVAFAMFRGPGAGSSIDPVTLWGTLPVEYINTALELHNRDAAPEDELVLWYQEFDQESFDQELLEALAEGRGPDMVLLGQDSLVEHEVKLFTLSFEAFPERTFKDTFIELGELYVTSDGVLALPFMVDPMVLYWNRDLFASSGIALPPTTWEELVSMVEVLTLRDQQNNVLRSGVALGEFQNITHAKEILTMLLLQAGDPVITRGGSDELVVTLGDRLGLPEVPAVSVLRFYTEFANSVKVLYSWNRSLPESKESFLAGDTAMYLGFASEVSELAERNPNLNFDVAAVPQIAGTDIKKTFGSMHALALMQNSNNLGNAFRAAVLMTQAEFLSGLGEVTALPPVRRDMLAEPAPDAISQLLYDAALIADAFLDPDKEGSAAAFQRMVEDVTSGRESVDISVGIARNTLSTLVQ